MKSAGRPVFGHFFNLLKGSRGEGAKRTGAATAPVALSPLRGRQAVPEGAIGGKESGTLYEHIELHLTKSPESLYPCGFEPFWGVISKSQACDFNRTGQCVLSHTLSVYDVTLKSH